MPVAIGEDFQPEVELPIGFDFVPEKEKIRIPRDAFLGAKTGVYALPDGGSTTAALPGPEDAAVMSQPLIPRPDLKIAEDDPQLLKAAKAATNTVGDFVSGMSSGVGLLGLIPPVGLTMMAASVPDLARQVQEAEKTPPGSAERWQAGTNVLGFMGLIAAGAKAAKGKGKEAGPTEPRPTGVEAPIGADFVPEATSVAVEQTPIVASVNETLARAEQAPPIAQAAPESQVGRVDPAALAAANEAAGVGTPARQRVERPLTPEEIAQREYQSELMAEAEGYQASHGKELLEAVIDAGGLPARGSKHRATFKHELGLLDETIRDPNRIEKMSPNKIFRTNAPSVDELATRLRDQGFNVPRPDDLIEMIDARLRTGRKTYGVPQLAAEGVFDPRLRRGEKGTADLFQGQDQPFNLAGQTGIDYAARQAAKEKAITEAETARRAQEAQSPELLDPIAAAPIPPTPAPPVPPGVTMTMDARLPVTMGRTRPGSVSVPEVLDSLKQVMVTSGSVGEIRAGRFGQKARGVFKSGPEVVRLEHIDNVPTAVHETGHALMKQFYGTIKASGLKSLPIAVRRELIGLGKALYGTRKPVAGYTGEGFAEYIRHYLTTDDATKVAPNTHRFFESQVLPAHPEVAAQLASARRLIDTYRHQGAIERANRQIVREPGWTKRTLGALKEFFSFQKIAESGAPLKELSKEAAFRSGKELQPAADPYKLFKMKRGSAGAIVERMVNDNMVDVWGNPTGGPSLKEAFAEVQGKRSEFLLYLFARRAVERWGKGMNPGITLEDANYIRTTLESQAFDRAASKYYQWWDGVLNYVVQADPTMGDLVARIKKGSSDYAPLARMLDESAVRREAAKSQANPLYRMHGSGLPVKDIFDQTMMGAARLINRANRALISNAVVKLASIEGMGRLIEEVPLSKVERKLNVEQIRSDLENMGVDTASIPENEIVKYYTPADQPKGSDPIISVKDASGNTRWFYVDPKLYDTLNKLEPFSLRSVPYLGFVLDFLVGAPKRLFTLGTTGLRPTFSLLTNPLRDPQGWLLQTKAGINPAKMAAAYFQAVAEQVRSAVGGKEGPLSNAAYNLGAHMAQPLGRDIQHTRRVSNELFHGRFLRVVKNPIDHARQLLSIPESFPRLAEFKRVADEIGWKPGTPMSPDQAVELSLAFKEATVDFSASGDVSRIINEAVPFFNPNIQGVRTAGRAFRDHPLRTTLGGIAGFTAPTLALWWLNKDKEWYKNLPWRERYYYTNIDDGKNVWQIPRAFEWGNLFGVIPEAALDSWYRQDPRAAKEALTHIFETQNPLDYPVALKVAKEQWQNRIDFWDRPIVPKSEVDLVPGAQVGPYTSKVARWLGEAFPNQVSPRRVDAAVRGFFGGAVSDVLDAAGLGSTKATRESERSDLPVVGRLWRRGGYYNAQSQYLADFWDLKQGLDARVQAMNMQMKDPARAQTVPLNVRDMAMAPLFDAAGQNISAAMHIASQMRESAGRQRLYKFATDEAKALLELWEKQEKTLQMRR